MPGLGSEEQPLTMTQAMNYPFIRPGHTIHLRGTVKAGDFECVLQGTPEQPITVIGERGAVIDGAMVINGEYTTWIDVDFTWSGWLDRVTYPQKSVDVYGRGARLINCNISDLYLFGFWEHAAELYGCVILNNGVERGSHSLYGQNFSSDRRKRVRHNIIGKSFGFNTHFYSTNTPLAGIDFEQNVIMPGRNLIGGEQADDDISIVENCGLDTRLEVGYRNDPNGRVTIKGNYFVNHYGAPLQLNRWRMLDGSDNTLIGGSDVMVYISPDFAVAQSWDNNAYYNTSAKAAPFAVNGVGWFTLDGWRVYSGFDHHSNMTSTIPHDYVFVWPNEYSSLSRRKGLIVIYNHSGAKEIDADLRPLGLEFGKQYALIQATDPLKDIYHFTYAGGGIAVDMRRESHSVAIPIKHNSALLDSTFPEFGAFILEAV